MGDGRMIVHMMPSHEGYIQGEEEMRSGQREMTDIRGLCYTHTLP